MKLPNSSFCLPKKSLINAAVFIAHPDDETIWMGGTILSRSEWSWKIFLSTFNATHPRGIAFQRAIELYRQSNNQDLTFEFTEVIDCEKKDEDVDEQKVKEKLNRIDLNEFDIIFTHNVDGEYGHIHHKILGEFFKDLRQKGLNIWHFLCPAIQNPKEKSIGEYIESTFLNSAVLSHKLFIFQCAYSTEHFLWTGFEDFMRFQFCSGLEMFTRY